MAEDLAPYIYLPVPSLNDLPTGSAGRDERLRTIIANLDKQHQMVRNNIISAIKARKDPQDLSAAPTIPTDPPAQHPDGMSISPAPSPPANDIEAHTEDLHSSPAITLLLHNLSVPYDEASSIDPCVPADGTIPPPPADMRQATPPVEIQRAREAMRLVEMYDGIADGTRKYYVGALQRGPLGSAAGAGGASDSSTGQRRPSMNMNRPRLDGYGSGTVSAVGYGRSAANASPANWSNRSPQVNASPVDASRDPRRRGR